MVIIIAGKAGADHVIIMADIMKIIAIIIHGPGIMMITAIIMIIHMCVESADIIAGVMDLTTITKAVIL